MNGRSYTVTMCGGPQDGTVLEVQGHQFTIYVRAPAPSRPAFVEHEPIPPEKIPVIEHAYRVDHKRGRAYYQGECLA